MGKFLVENPNVIFSGYSTLSTCNIGVAHDILSFELFSHGAVVDDSYGISETIRLVLCECIFILDTPRSI